MNFISKAFRSLDSTSKTTETEELVRLYARTNNILEFEKLIANHDININNADENGYTSLHYSCKEGYLNIVRLCLLNRGDIYSITKGGYTPLHIACIAGHLLVVKILIEYGSNPNLCDENGDTPLHHACREGFADIAMYLVERGGKLSLTNWSDLSPIDVAKTEDLKEGLQELMLKSDDNKRAGVISARLRMEEDLQLLIKSKANNSALQKQAHLQKIADETKIQDTKSKMKAVDADVLAEFSRIHVPNEIIQVENKRLEKFAISLSSKSKPTSPVIDKISIEKNKSRRETSPPSVPFGFLRNSKNSALLDINDGMSLANTSSPLNDLSIKSPNSINNEKSSIQRIPSIKGKNIIKRSDFENLYESKRLESQNSPTNSNTSITISPKLNSKHNEYIDKILTNNQISPKPNRVTSPFKKKYNGNSNIESLTLSPRFGTKAEPLRELFSSLHAELNPQFSGSKDKIQFLAKAFKTDSNPDDTVSEKLSLNCEKIISEKVSLHGKDVTFNSNPLFNSDITPSSAYNFDKFDTSELNITTPVFNAINSKSPKLSKGEQILRQISLTPPSEKKVDINTLSNFIGNMKKKSIEPRNIIKQFPTSSPDSLNVTQPTLLNEFEKLKEVIFDGYLMKRSPQFTLFPIWQNRYFRLYFDRLEYYSSDKDKIKGKIDINNCSYIKITSSTSFSIHCRNRIYDLQAESEYDATNWCHYLKLNGWKFFIEPIELLH